MSECPLRQDASARKVLVPLEHNVVAGLTLRYRDVRESATEFQPVYGANLIFLHGEHGDLSCARPTVAGACTSWH